MSILTSVLIVVALMLSIFIPFGAFLLGERKKGKFKTALVTNLFFFFGILLMSNVMMFGGTVSAAPATTEAGNMAAGLGYIAAALSTGLSCVGGGIATASAASAALGAISEDGSILGKSLIYVGLSEGVCLWGFIIAFMILGKL